MFMMVWTHSAFASGWLRLSLGSVAMDMNAGSQDVQLHGH